jgi:AsnC family.
MMGIYIMIIARPGEIRGIINELRKLEHLDNIAIITGEYDIIVKASLDSMDEVADLTDRVNQIKGIKRTHTHMVEREISL